MDIRTKWVSSPCFTLAHYNTQSQRCRDADTDAQTEPQDRIVKGNAERRPSADTNANTKHDCYDHLWVSFRVRCRLKITDYR